MSQIYYDPSTDTIHGATPGSWAYAHEERHRWQYRTIPRLAERTAWLHISSYYAAILSGIVLLCWAGPAWMLFGIGASMLPHIILTFLIELDAYIVGTWNYFRRRT